MNTIFSSDSSLSRLTKILFLLSGFAIGLGCIRIGYTGNLKGIFLVWNLFLAWIPFIIAAFLAKQKTKINSMVLLIFILLWLLFLPNAPYIITDLIHLRPRDGIPLWYDAIVIFLFAFDGLILGIVSTYLVHELIKRYTNTIMSWLFLSACFILSGYGIYLGRFLRWNSWDIVVNPVDLLQDSFQKLTNPVALVVTFIFSLIMFFSYLIFYQLIHLKSNSYDTQNH